ncbi:MAG: S41 family peptidase [Flavobacteriales bacterium]
MTFASKIFALIFSFLLVTSCNSVKRYNETINSKHSVKELRSDIDFTFKKIEKLHPNLYWFISKEELSRKIDSVKNSITSPLTSKEFYYILSPLVSEIRQGHNAVGFPMDRFEKEEFEERFEKTSNDFTKLEFERVEDKIIISDVFDSIKSLQFAELLKIDSFEVKEILDKYNFLRSSDGFNTTFYERREGLFLPSYYRIENPTLDSVTLTLKKEDLVFDTTFYRAIDSSLLDKKKIKKEEKAKDKNAEKDSVEKEKHDNKPNHIRGYDKRTDRYTRDYKFLKDSSVGYLKIRGFSNGPFSDLYDEFFAYVDSAESQTVILDLRNNLGGRLNEIHYLMEYLALDEFITIEPMEANTAIPRTNALWSANNQPLLIVLKSIVTPFLYVYEKSTSKKKNGVYYHTMKSSKRTEPKENSFKGKVYVLVNGNSFSASSIISSNLQGSGRATIVGEETGGTFNGTVAGVFKPIKLPNSKLRVQFGLGMIKAPYTESPDGKGVIPDVTILPTLEHRLNNIDTELEWILKEVESNKKVMDTIPEREAELQREVEESKQSKVPEIQNANEEKE